VPVAHKNIVIIGSGFGGSMTGLSLARAVGKSKSILMLERGTWWTTPVSTVQDKDVANYQTLASHGEPVQYWSSQNHFRGFVDLFTRCYRRPGNEDGLYDLTLLGKTGFLGLFGGKSDGVSILRACGVGGGSLVYSNITIRPPDIIFNDNRWPLTWSNQERDHYFDLARHAIGFGVISARDAEAGNRIPFLDNGAGGLPPGAINTGLSNIVARTARLDPHWQSRPDPNSSRPIHSIHYDGGVKPEQQLDAFPINRLWIDRARVFQTAMHQLTPDYGAVDLSINDLTPENAPSGAGKPPVNYPIPEPPGGGAKPPQPKNYCERQGRCNVGCLPGARHTLNKQLMPVVLKTDANPTPLMQLQTLTEVDVIRALPQGGYEVRYLRRDSKDPSKTASESVTADVVILAAGCLGTNEILLRSKAQGTLPGLSERLGFGFSTNGDYIAFLEKTREWVSLVRGPVTTSYAHFNTGDPRTGEDATGQTFHTLEDQGIPPALASLVGQGVPLIRSFGRGRQKLLVLLALLRWAWQRLKELITAPFTNSIERADLFRSEDEIIARMMCIVGVGRDAALGQFRLGGPGESSLRVKRTDGKEFWDDPIYPAIQKSLDKAASLLRDPNDPKAEFRNPFLSDAFGNAKNVTVSHPLGGCAMGKDARHGVTDEFGRVFDTTQAGGTAVYKGLYVADASMIPASLGVNPSLTISTLALRVADKILEELR
jgi:choline dehydrogenase-like flavoprotein